MKSVRKSAVIILISVFFIAACAAGDGDQKSAERVVDEYHRLYNEQNYEEIFNTAHEEARRLKSKEGLGYALAKAYEQYGKHVGSELVYTKISPVPESKSRMVEFAYRSKFERGERLETFLIVVDDQKAALHSIGEMTEEELEKLQKQ